MIRSHHAVAAVLAFGIATSPAFGETVVYAAREGSQYITDELVASSGEVPMFPVEGDTYEAVLSYMPTFADLLTMAAVTWDPNTEALEGFTENTSSLPYVAKQSETVSWLFTSGNWQTVNVSTVTTEGSTSVIERTPLVVPLIAPPAGNEGDAPLSAVEILELQMAGVDYAFQQYLDPNYDLSTVTRAQLQQDLLRLQDILAGNYTPPPYPEPGSVALLGVGLVALIWRIRRTRG
ncbi:MAG: PEP-CTERM sorting domain-containing protein [Betaproteobacteria bacterium]|nr:PEP-CTERM sorting domain-containing protein [Betaproteobacteria bacterium]